MVILGFLLMCAGVGLALFTWGILMTRGWTGMYFERKELRNPRRPKCTH